MGLKRGKKQRHREPVRFAVVGQGYFSQAAVLPAFRRRLSASRSGGA